MLSYSRKDQIFEYTLDNRSFNYFSSTDDLSSHLGIVLSYDGNNDDTVDEDQDNKIDLWITDPVTTILYNHEINEQEITENDFRKHYFDYGS
jgi:hypothetical protein